MAQSSPEMSDPVSKSELIKIIECPVCMEVPYPPIYQCVKGHSICKSCMPKLNKCPICKSCLSSACRNFMVEEIVRASKHFCPYKNDGCKVEKTGELMEAHINNCPYGPFICPRNGLEMCKAKLKFPETSSHFFFQHMATIAPGPTQLISRTVHYNCFDINGTLKSDLNWPPNQILFDEKHFLVEAYTLKDRIFLAVLYIGCESDAKKYRVKIVCQPGQVTCGKGTPVDSSCGRNQYRIGTKRSIENPEQIFAVLQYG